jgi:sec-independent protein translocase protein TatB
MPNITGGEIVIIMLVALIVLGPQRLPEAARQVSKAFREFRRVQDTVQSEIRATLDAAGEPIRETTKPVTQTTDLLRAGGATPEAETEAPGRLTQQPIAPEPATAGDEAPAGGEPVANGQAGSEPGPVEAEPSPGATPARSTATFRPRDNGSARPAPADDWGEAPLHDDQ